LRVCIDRGVQEHDFQDISSFLSTSWAQTPDRGSKTRFMKPRCVVRELGPSRIKDADAGNEKKGDAPDLMRYLRAAVSWLCCVRYLLKPKVADDGQQENYDPRYSQAMALYVSCLIRS
jgi:hypothetical protein